MEVGKELFGIAALLIGVAFAALLIGHSSDTAKVITAAGGTFNELLKTVELAGGSGFGGFSGMSSPYQSFVNNG